MKAVPLFVPKRRRKWPRVVLAVFLAPFVWVGYVLLTLPDVSALETEAPRETAFMKHRKAAARREGRAYQARREWVEFDRIPELLKEAVRIAEDAAFYSHQGVDYAELKESIKKDLRERRFARGGSTITQQLAKNLYLSPSKNPLRKVREYFIARRLEKVLIKDRIFALYLNVIELGPGVFGVQTAARHHFGRDAADLSLEEIVRLTAIIPRPLTTNPRGSTPWFRWRCRTILGKLKLYKKISPDDYDRLIPLFAAES